MSVGSEDEGRDALESDLGSIAELLLIVHQMHVKAQPGTYRAISAKQPWSSWRPDLRNQMITVCEGHYAIFDTDASELMPCSIQSIGDVTNKLWTRRAG